MKYRCHLSDVSALRTLANVLKCGQVIRAEPQRNIIYRHHLSSACQRAGDIDSKMAIAHDKVIVIDGQIIIAGSFNFIKAAPGEERREPAGDPR